MPILTIPTPEDEARINGTKGGARADTLNVYRNYLLTLHPSLDASPNHFNGTLVRVQLEPTDSRNAVKNGILRAIASFDGIYGVQIRTRGTPDILFFRIVEGTAPVKPKREKKTETTENDAIKPKRAKKAKTE